MKNKIVESLKREIEFFSDNQNNEKLMCDEKYHLGFINGLDYAIKYIIKLYEENKNIN